MKNRIKALALAFVALVAGCPAAQSQTDPMPGWRNPTTFYAGTDYYWSARVGERCSTSSFNDTTTGYYIMSTCADSKAQDIKGHTNIIATKYDSDEDYGISGCGYEDLWDANGKRFQIITKSQDGIDELTKGINDGLTRIPEGYTSSIRLGDPRASGNASYSHSWASGSNKGSEALFYTMRVTEQNALLVINYAVVGRCYPHSTYQAGEFLIRVVGEKIKSDGTKEWDTEPINDSLWFKISAPDIPSNNIPPSPWVMGHPGSAYGGTTCAYVYVPWTRVAVSLNKYLYDNVRIEMYTSDCIYNVDPIYAYICGDYAPMSIATAGCPPPDSDVIDSLAAPEGMLTYKWYVAKRGAVPSSDHLIAAYMDTVQFRQVFPATGDTTYNGYMPRLDDFRLTDGPNAGDTVSEQTFMCVMTSAMDPAKPFHSRVYVNVENRRPMLSYTYEAQCDGTVNFTSTSTTYSPSGLVDDSTRWVVYADTLGMVPLDTVWGVTASYKFPARGRYSARLYCTTAGIDNGEQTVAPCTVGKLFKLWAKGQPPAEFTVSGYRLCENEQLTLTASGEVQAMADSLRLDWIIDGDTLPSHDALAHTVLNVGGHVIVLSVTNGDSCVAYSNDSVYVFGQPVIDLGSDINAICPGDSVRLEAAGSIDYTWNAIPPDSTLASRQGESSFTVSPEETTTYYLLPSTDNPCSVEGAQVTIEVIPAPLIEVKSSAQRVNKEDPTLVLQDVSEYRHTSSWLFSDGGMAEGQRVTHSFVDLDVDSVFVSLHSCNRLGCCSDSTIHYPVEVTTVWFPNVFTPDKDQNNRFGIITSLTLIDYEIYIFNRNGQLVFKSTDQADTWDGTTAQGTVAPQGTYAYVYRYAFSPDSYHEGKGTVTLLR